MTNHLSKGQVLRRGLAHALAQGLYVGILVYQSSKNGTAALLAGAAAMLKDAMAYLDTTAARYAARYQSEKEERQ